MRIPFFHLLTLLLFPFGLLAQEICNNAIDDDGDGLIDFLDDDCECEFIEIRSLIANPSFEDNSCCPETHYNLQCARPWIQAFGMTPDYYHSCGWMGDNVTVPTPFPDGQAAVGFANGIVPQTQPVSPDWKEYAVTCLLQTMKAGVSYRIEFSMGFSTELVSPPMELTIYGSSDCDNYPFAPGVITPGCPTKYPNWTRLEGKVLEGTGGPSWVNDFFEFTPEEDINIIAIGPPCEHFEGINGNYYFLDNLIMEETFKFQFRLNEAGDPCTNNFTLSVNSPATLEFQWYKDSIALVGETASSLLVSYGSGNYQVRMINVDGCLMSPPYDFDEDLSKESTVEATICPGETYVDGDFTANRKGNYQYVLSTEAGCDSLINLVLDVCEIYIPNAFSPNDDGINDTFKALGQVSAGSYTMKIFNRWGSLIYEGPEWDGTMNGEPVPNGIYVYLIEARETTEDGSFFKGKLTLMR